MMIISKTLSDRLAKDYYREDYSNVENNCYGAEGMVASEWFGHIAAKMELAGEVSQEQYHLLVNGHDPRAGEWLIRNAGPYMYTNRDGEQVIMPERCAGWEAIFGAPTSVSLAALVGGDGRIREAHWKAVNTALAALEEYTFAGMNGAESVVRTGKMIAARFEHDVAPAARESDLPVPHLHTHTIILNLTQLSGGEWRALDSRELLKSQEYATAIYRSVLATELPRLGYELEADEETGEFEIRGFTREYLEVSRARAEEVEDFDIEARNARRVFEAIEPHTQDCDRTSPLVELRRGDIIEVTGGRGIITEIDGDGISVLGEDGRTLGLDLEDQFVIRRSPDQIEDWIFLSLQWDLPIRFYLMVRSCWKCGFVGLAAAMQVEGYLVVDARSLFHYPGARRQLGEFFDKHQDLKAEFGAVKERFSKTTGETNLSQGCARCDALWGVFPLTEDFRSRVVDLPYSAESGHIIPIFEVDVSRLFDEGETPQTGV
jgi:conjugative relaxase-like TrwC/TraI family protein